MNFLELVKKAWRDCGQTGDGPAAVTGVAGHQLRFVNWVREAWKDIQRESSEWSFLKIRATCTLTAGQENHTSGDLLITDLLKPLAVLIFVSDQWLPLNLIISSQSSDEWLRANKSSGQPCVVYFDNGVFSFDTLPDKNYQLRIYYKRTPQELVANTDVPICDAAYHDTITYLAKKKYALFDEDQALLTEANEAYERTISDMRADLTPQVTFGRSAF
ncbi:MAG TPA: hypothetical protein VN030_11565 [Cellvibrio sp.]|nr:hypothetical protein [Cellvibrio sp.]